MYVEPTTGAPLTDEALEKRYNAYIEEWGNSRDFDAWLAAEVADGFIAKL